MITTAILFVGLCAVNLASAYICPPPFHYWELSDFYQKPPPETFMTTPELIRHYDYPVETYEVSTSDGFILTIFRIPYSNKTEGHNATKEPILVQHGLASSSDDWLMQMPKDNLPFILADLGYDVWLGNARGNDYSQRHYLYNVSDIRFWDFSVHEMGIYDIPAVIKFILKKTGKERLSYVGHSMGTTMFFIAMDKHQELQVKVRKMVAFAPSAYYSHIKAPMGLLALTPSPVLEAFTEHITGGRVLYKPFNEFTLTYGPHLCSGNIPACICQSIIFFISGYDFQKSSDQTVLIVAGHTPSDTSGKTLIHFLQWARGAEFQEYDYGVFENWMTYGTAHPPKYNLSANNVETFAMYSKNDWFVVPEDAERAIRELGNVTAMRVVLEEFGHLDFLYAIDVKTQVYDHCVDFLAT